MVAAPTPTPAPGPCPCGHGVDHEHTTEEPIYNARDYLWMLLGVSSRAVPHARKCAICGHVFETTEARRPW